MRASAGAARRLGSETVRAAHSRGGWMVFLGCMSSPQRSSLRLALATRHDARQSCGPAAFALRIPAALVFDHGADQEAWIIAEPGRMKRSRRP